MERLMERKLALLEADYQETLAAEARATAARALTSPAAARAAGYTDPSGYTQHLPDGNDDEDMEGEEEEWSEAWTQFKAEMREEEARIRALPPSDDEAAVPPPPPPASIHAPLTPAKITAIRSHMSTIKLRPPPWAIGMSEEVWMARILERAGFARKAQGGGGAGQEERKGGGGEGGEEKEEGKDGEEKRRLRARRKAKKAKQGKKKAKEGQPQGQAAVEEAKQHDGFAEFEPAFPSLGQTAAVDVTAQQPSEAKVNE